MYKPRSYIRESHPIIHHNIMVEECCQAHTHMYFISRDYVKFHTHWKKNWNLFHQHILLPPHHHRIQFFNYNKLVLCVWERVYIRCWNYKWTRLFHHFIISTIIYFLRKYKFSLDCIISRYRRYLKTKFCMLNKHASINYNPLWHTFLYSDK